MKAKKVKNIKTSNKMITIFGIIIIFIIVAITYFHTNRAGNLYLGHAVKAKNISSLFPQTKQNILAGLPMIPPQSDSTMTLDYAREWINNHPFHNGKTTTDQPSSIENIYFATDQQVKATIDGIWPENDPNTTLLVVIENGPFRLDNASYLPGDPIPIAQQVVRIFNAHTGNLLMWKQVK